MSWRARREFPDATVLAGSATSKQVEFAERMGISMPSGVNQDDASRIIEQELANREQRHKVDALEARRLLIESRGLVPGVKVTLYKDSELLTVKSITPAAFVCLKEKRGTFNPLVVYPVSQEN